MEKNVVAMVFVVIAVVLVAAILLNYFNLGEPAIQVSPTSYDFGEIPQKAVEHQFQVKNAGGKTLEILLITTSCGCTTAEIDSERIEPGEEATLTVKFDPNAMAEPVEGRADRVVYIKSNDPEIPEMEIEITAYVNGEL